MWGGNLYNVQSIYVLCVVLSYIFDKIFSVVHMPIERRMPIDARVTVKPKYELNAGSFTKVNDLLPSTHIEHKSK